MSCPRGITWIARIISLETQKVVVYYYEFVDDNNGYYFLDRRSQSEVNAHTIISTAKVMQMPGPAEQAQALFGVEETERTRLAALVRLSRAAISEHREVQRSAAADVRQRERQEYVERQAGNVAAGRSRRSYPARTSNRAAAAASEDDPDGV